MSPAKKRSSRTRKKTKKPSWIRLHGGRLLVFFLLFSLLVVSLATVTYVVFFRTVFAAEPGTQAPLVRFEEPDPPAAEQLPEIMARKPATAKSEGAKPRVAIVIDDLGYHRSLDSQLLNLDLPLTYSFLPGAPYTAELLEQAKRLEKVIFLHLPLEAKDPKWCGGKETLLLTDSPEVQAEKFAANLDLVPGAVGVNNHMGSRYTEDARAMRSLLERIDSHSLIFIDSFTTAASKGLGIAQEMGMPTARRHVFLDNVLQTEAICDQLTKLMEFAADKGEAIGIGHPHPETLEALTTCLDKWQDKVELMDAKHYIMEYR